MNHINSGTQVKWFLAAWLLLLVVLIGITLNSTKPFKGDESFYITSAIEMIRSGSYLEPVYFGNLRLQKPILPYWITVAGYHIFGISLWSGRVPFLVLSVLLLVILFFFTRHIVSDELYALLSVTMLSSSILFIGFCRHAMCDLPFTFFITISLFSFYLALEQKSGGRWWYTLGYINAAFACLSKFLLGLAPIVALGAYLVISKPAKWKSNLGSMFHPFNLLVFLVLLLPWYMYIAVKYPDILISQSGNESSALMVNPPRILSNVIYYLLVLIRFFIPFTLVAVYLWVRKRFSLPQNFRYFIWYFILVLVLFIVFIDRQRERYLFIMFPTLSVVMAALFQKACIFKPLFKISVILFLIETAGFIMYPYIAGEQVKDLVEYWQEHYDGRLSLSSIERRKISWAQALTHGELIIDSNDTEYIIANEEGLAAQPDYHIIIENERISRIRFVNLHLQFEKQRYYLLERNTDL